MVILFMGIFELMMGLAIITQKAAWVPVGSSFSLILSLAGGWLIGHGIGNILWELIVG